MTSTPARAAHSDERTQVDREPASSERRHRRGAGPLIMVLALLVAAGGFLLFFFLEHDPMRRAYEQARADLAELRTDRRTDRQRLRQLERDRDRLTRELERRTASEAMLRRERDELATSRVHAQTALAALTEAQNALRERLQAELASGEAELRQDADGGIAVALDERILFPPGEAELNPRGLEVLARVAQSLGELADRRIIVEGHTDSTPIASERAAFFPTNWELSTARATTVVRFLEQQGIAGERLSAVGYAQHRPVAANDSVAGRRRNRRIELRLER